MTEPKPTWDREWQEAKEEVELLGKMIKEAENEKTATPLQQLFISRESFIKAMEHFEQKIENILEEIMNDPEFGLISHDTSLKADKMHE
jgi:hypothetical protein